MSDTRPGTEGGNGPQATAAAPALISEESTAREQHLAELRERYLNGYYSVDSRELSASIIDKHLNR